jgi:dipeptidyl-peptidase-4
VLRDRDGKVVKEIERADVSAYDALKAPAPKSFVVKARDGKTDIYGTLHFPSTFDPKKKYPILDSDYPGPQTIKAPKRYQAGSIEQATAELGFIVFQVDGLGQPWRSKEYHDYAYANMGDTGGLEDHIAALKQLAKEYPYLDLDRVGIFGHSGGGFASARAMLLYPDFYKVAVSSAGNHDQLGYLWSWGEKYQGPVSGRNYDNQDTTLIAKNLKGKLLLAYGDMDDNVNPTLSIRLIDALIKANRDFDVLVMPNRNHSFATDPYFNRRRWDYFVKNLLGAEPPKGFELKAVIPPLE